MDECTHIQKMMVEALYDELGRKAIEQFRSHLAQCPVCAEQYGDLQSTLSIMDRREYPAPGPDYWERYQQKLEQRLSREDPQVISLGKVGTNWRHRLHWKPQWGYRIATGLALVALGIIIGRVYLAPPEPVVTTPAPGPLQTQNAAVIQQTRNYLERSKLVLMGLVNMDPDQEANIMQNFSVQQDVSQSLVKEAGVLKKKLTSPQQERLRELVSELEMILRQVANLDNRSDMDEIRIIRMGVQQKFLLFKINVEEMNAPPPDTTAVQKPTKKLVL